MFIAEEGSGASSRASTSTQQSRFVYIKTAQTASFF